MTFFPHHRQCLHSPVVNLLGMKRALVGMVDGISGRWIRSSVSHGINEEFLGNILYIHK